MTSSLSVAAAYRTTRTGLAERIFVGPSARRLLTRVEDGLALIDAALDEHLHVADALADAVSRYLNDAGGKRIRPMLTILTAQLGDGTTDGVVNAATAIEMTHLASLYHDDVMDAAEKRRGVPSAHVVWGNNVAILTGDLLFSRASQIMARQGDRAIQLQADTFERLVLGQMHETVGPQPGDDPIAFYLQVLADKTGSLIGAAAQSGVLFSNAGERYEKPLHTFGLKVGVAFQLLDDVIDLSSQADGTGKVPGTDLRAGVPTMPLLLLRQETDAASQQLVRDIEDAVALAAGQSSPALEAAVARLRAHPVTGRTVDLARRWADEAIGELTALPRGPVREALERFAEAMVDRTR